MRSRIVRFEDLEKKPECRRMVDHYTRMSKTTCHEVEPFVERFTLENGVVFERYSNGDVSLSIPDELP